MLIKNSINHFFWIPFKIPGDKAIHAVADLYDIVSRKSINLNITGFVITPISLGNSGQRSLTSKIKGFFLKKRDH